MFSIILYNVAPSVLPEVNAVAFGSFTIIVTIFSFSLPMEYGEFVGYNISYNSSTTQVSVLSPNTSYYLRDLQPSTLYTVQVAIVSTTGQGPAQATNVMTEPAGVRFDRPSNYGICFSFKAYSDALKGVCVMMVFV